MSRYALFLVASLLVALAGAMAPAAAQTQTGGAARQIVERQVAPDLYFVHDETSSNAAFLVTGEGVLVVDTRQHPRDGADLLERIRKVTDKPIKWVVNTHFHGDHHYGNSVFKAAGGTIVAHEDTARIMAKVDAKEQARRQAFFKSRGYDPAEVKLTLPDVTFDKSLVIKLGGREVRLIYLGPGQNAGDTFVHFPHARAVFTPGAFTRRGMPNMMFTPSVESWIGLLDKVAEMDIDTIIPPHGDLAAKPDLKELANFLRFEHALVKKAVDARMSIEDAVKTLDFSQYRDWHNFGRRENDIRGLYELIQTGRRSYFD